ncbi:MAG: hypothetical protein JW786_07525 [Desulfobacterales bacterium]|nr:hypothetical protein [Desulfobacterales bacterium]
MKLTGKMEKWIETRLWNRKVDNESITIKQIVSELTHLFGISLTPGTQKQLEVRIEQIRSRIYKRHKRWLHRRAGWAKNLGVPEKMIQRWYRAGWIDPQKPETINVLAGMIFERDYYLRFIESKDSDDIIPENPDISISSV